MASIVCAAAELSECAQNNVLDLRTPQCEVPCLIILSSAGGTVGILAMLFRSVFLKLSVCRSDSFCTASDYISSVPALPFLFWMRHVRSKI